MTSNTNIGTPLPLVTSAPIPISTSSTKHHHHHHTRITSSSGSSVDASPDLLSDSSTAVVGTPLLTSASLSTPRTIHSSHHSKRTQPHESDSFSDEDFNNFELAATSSKTHKRRHNETPPPVVAPISCSAPAGSAGSPMLLAAMSTPRKPTSREDFECIRFIGKGDVGRVYIFFPNGLLI